MSLNINHNVNLSGKCKCMIFFSILAFIVHLLSLWKRGTWLFTAIFNCSPSSEILLTEINFWLLGHPRFLWCWNSSQGMTVEGSWLSRCIWQCEALCLFFLSAWRKAQDEFVGDMFSFIYGSYHTMMQTIEPTLFSLLSILMLFACRSGRTLESGRCYHSRE